MIVILFQDILHSLRYFSILDVIWLNEYQLRAKFLAYKARHTTLDTIIPSKIVGSLDHLLIADSHRLVCKIWVVLDLYSSKKHIHVYMDPRAR